MSPDAFGRHTKNVLVEVEIKIYASSIVTRKKPDTPKVLGTRDSVSVGGGGKKTSASSKTFFKTDTARVVRNNHFDFFLRGRG